MFRRSAFGHRIAEPSGILQLMEDLGNALTTNREAIMMGGGNPAQIPAVQEVWRKAVEDLAQSPERLGDLLANYDPPAGNPDFRKQLAAFLRRSCGWEVGPENIAITNGGQTAFFFLLNLFGGETRDGDYRKVVLPIVPEYIGYANQGAGGDLFRGYPGRVEETGPHRFKYRIDFEAIEADGFDDVGAICISRPTNPSANVITDRELNHLSELAQAADVPLILDNAYGLPFPGVIHCEAQPYWNPKLIQTLSLSKLGLPGTRTGMVLGPPDVIDDISAMTAVIGLANNNVGQGLVQPLLEGNQLPDLCNKVIQPYYRERRDHALEVLDATLADHCAWRVHEPEGAFFLWLWLPDLPITSQELYQRLKETGVIVVPGDYFFFGTSQDDAHQHQCLRISYTQPKARVEEGLERLAAEVIRAHQS